MTLKLNGRIGSGEYNGCRMGIISLYRYWQCSETKKSSDDTIFVVHYNFYCYFITAVNVVKLCSIHIVDVVDMVCM